MLYGASGGFSHATPEQLFWGCMCFVALGAAVPIVLWLFKEKK